MVLKENREDHVVLRGKRRTMQLRQQERLCREEKGRKVSCRWAVRRYHMALD